MKATNGVVAPAPDRAGQRAPVVLQRHDADVREQAPDEVRVPSLEALSTTTTGGRSGRSARWASVRTTRSRRLRVITTTLMRASVTPPRRGRRSAVGMAGSYPVGRG